MKHVAPLVAASTLAAVAVAAPSMAADITSFYTSIDGLGLNDDGTTYSLTVGSDYPAAESPAQAIDDDTATKFLSFPGAGLNGAGEKVGAATGFLFTLDTPMAIGSLQFTTANDFASRDPGEVAIYGITAAGDAASMTGTITLDDMTLVYAGTTGIPAFADVNSGRFTEGDLIEFTPSDAFSAYALVITDLVRYEGNAPTNSQFAEVSLFEATAVPEPASLALVGLGGLALIRRRRRAS